MKFNIVSPGDSSTATSTEDASSRITAMIKEAPVFLFMKGTPQMPQCGFSYRVSDILKKWGVPFESFNVLSDGNIREGIKEYSNWPTIPQLYIQQEFVGGCDIVEELSSSGELGDLLAKALPEHQLTPPPRPGKADVISPQDAKALLESDSKARLIDVRTPEEWDIVHLEKSELLDQELAQKIISEEDRTTPLLCLCHHGARSMDAARFFASEGFQKVYSVTGGIDAWAEQVDSSLARY